MTCPSCGRYSPPDRETGYDVDHNCPQCIRELQEQLPYIKRTTTFRINSIKDWPIEEQQDPAEVALQAIYADITTLVELATKAAEAGDKARLWWLYGALKAIEHHATQATNHAAELTDRASLQPISPIVTADQAPF